MAFPTVVVTPGTGQTINTLPNAGQALAADSLPVVLPAIQAASLAAPVLAAGTAVVGKVGIDQTTPGTTNLVAADITKVAGATIAQGNGTAATAIRVSLPTDGTGVVGLIAGTADVGKVDASGTKVTAATIPTGGVGFLGWLSAIWYQLTQILTVKIDQTTPGTTNATQKIAGTGGGATLYLLRSAATANATSLKASPGNVYGLQLINRSTTANAYFNLFDKATAPTVGTDTPVKSICIPAAVGVTQPTVVVINFPMPISFTLGIAFDIVGGTGLVADTTAVALNDVTVNIDYK